MLSGYYFLGLGNSTEGYSILSGEGLSVAHVFPKINLYNQIISIHPFVNANKYIQPIFKLPLTNGLTSGYLIPLTGWNSNEIFDVNAIQTSYTTAPETFNYNDIFVLNSTFNLYKTTNRLHETPDYGIGDYDYLHGAGKFWKITKQYEKLMVPQNLLNLSIIRSETENIYEFLDQFNVSLNDALMSGYMPIWDQSTMKMPISNYGADLSTSSEIYSFRIYDDPVDHHRYYVTKPFFGRTISSYDGYYEDYSKDVYVKNDQNKFVPVTTGYNIYESLFDQFTFNEQKYVLSGSNKFADLYKNQGDYFPINYSENSISSNIQVLDKFYISKLGYFEILSGEYINKANCYTYDEIGNMYHFGDWTSGLIYTPGWNTNINCESFNIQAPSGEFNNYTSIIGCKPISEDNKTYYKSNEILKSLHNVPSTIQIYISIDPASYSIAL